jgi:hypothetical protein
MSNKKWLEDLEQGNKGERVVADYIVSNRPQYGIAEFRNDKKYDVRFSSITEEDLTIEVKTDRYEFIKGYKTWNIYVEVSCSGRDSGIMATEADYFIYYFPDFEEAYMISSEKLRKFIKDNPVDTDGLDWKTGSGDGGRVTGVTIHRKYWRKLFNVVTIKKDETLWK